MCYDPGISSSKSSDKLSLSANDVTFDIGECYLVIGRPGKISSIYRKVHSINSRAHVIVWVIRPCDVRASRFSITATESPAGEVRIVEQNVERGNCAERRNHFVRSFSLWYIRSIFKVKARRRKSHDIPILDFADKIHLFVDMNFI